MSENVKGLKKLLTALDKLPKKLDDGIETALIVASEKIVEDSKDNIQRNGQIDSGDMFQSQGYRKISDKTYKVQSNDTGEAPYDIFQEHGTRFLPSRPFFFPAVFKNRDKLAQEIEDLLEDEINGI